MQDAEIAQKRARGRPRLDERLSAAIEEAKSMGGTVGDTHEAVGQLAKRFGLKPPSLRTIQSRFQGAEPEPWRLSQAEPEDARLVLEMFSVLVVGTSSRRSKLTETE